jgi:hypothetical protein
MLSLPRRLNPVAKGNEPNFTSAPLNQSPSYIYLPDRDTSQSWLCYLDQTISVPNQLISREAYDYTIREWLHLTVK